MHDLDSLLFKETDDPNWGTMLLLLTELRAAIAVNAERFNDFIKEAVAAGALLPPAPTANHGKSTFSEYALLKATVTKHQVLPAQIFQDVEARADYLLDCFAGEQRKSIRMIGIARSFLGEVFYHTDVLRFEPLLEVVHVKILRITDVAMSEVLRSNVLPALAKHPATLVSLLDNLRAPAVNGGKSSLVAALSISIAGKLAPHLRASQLKVLLPTLSFAVGALGDSVELSKECDWMCAAVLPLNSIERDVIVSNLLLEGGSALLAAPSCLNLTVQFSGQKNALRLVKVIQVYNSFSISVIALALSYLLYLLIDTNRIPHSS